MANLEFMDYRPVRETVEGNKVTWVPDVLASRIVGLPQLFWKDGEPWNEANYWALIRAKEKVGERLKTITSLMKHLHAYATWLESNEFDWRHFPIRVSDRPIVKFRASLIVQRDIYRALAPSTATARMAAVLQFYRFAKIHEFVERRTSMWHDKSVVHRYYDNTGFSRTMVRASSSLAIPNRSRVGDMLEDGLTPISQEHASELLKFTQHANLLELHYMLSCGLLSGARLETIITLSVRDIENAFEHNSIPAYYCIRVGPATRVKTKFDVSGNLLVPGFLIDALKGYAYSMRRLNRQALAAGEDRERLFLTIRGKPYSHQSFNRLMTDLRRRCCANGMKFMQRFKFHQTRATFGTTLMEIALKVTTAANAVAFVRDAMLHKDESTTFKYVKLVQKGPAKARVSKEFASLFSGVVCRDWSKFHA